MPGGVVYTIPGIMAGDKSCGIVDAEDRNRDGHNFTRYASTFCDLGFLRLNELGDIAVHDLWTEAPGVFSFGVACTILGFAKADLLLFQDPPVNI
ncbi:hypothetical protein BOTBODRAFT_181011 [Botryobasidium botryosum FD-172 SS1]|uniref:Uncharacterized protein n=1 Tax=Botryobasidium botryosum (strain FD-172 SS1) TaxID=930990 RepID=A0A067M623_BOTB1|nr:hypothetical protein BOTBODRAFT_181011 [Botryobasidium botryosum FD-172 SS1]